MNNIPLPTPYPTAVVLGGGLFVDGTLTILSIQRLKAAIDLFRRGLVDTITVLGERKSTYFENALEFSEAGAEKRAQYLVRHNVPIDKIIKIPYGRDTIGEALAVKQYGSFNRFLLVTSDLHISRAHWIFANVLGREVQIDDYPVPCDGLLIEEEERAYLAATQEYFSARSNILNDTSDWHNRHKNLYNAFTAIHDSFHPKGKQSQAYCAVKE